MCYCSAEQKQSTAVPLSHLFGDCAYTNKCESVWVCMCVCVRWSTANWQCLERTSLHRTAIPLHYLTTPHHSHPHMHAHTKLDEDIYSSSTQYSLLSLPSAQSQAQNINTKMMRYVPQLNAWNTVCYSSNPFIHPCILYGSIILLHILFWDK